MGGGEKEGGEEGSCVGGGGGDVKLISVVGGGLKDGNDREGRLDICGGAMLMLRSVGRPDGGVGRLMGDVGTLIGGVGGVSPGETLGKPIGSRLILGSVGSILLGSSGATGKKVVGRVGSSGTVGNRIDGLRGLMAGNVGMFVGRERLRGLMAGKVGVFSESVGFRGLTPGRASELISGNPGMLEMNMGTGTKLAIGNKVFGGIGSTLLISGGLSAVGKVAIGNKVFGGIGSTLLVSGGLRGNKVFGGLGSTLLISGGLRPVDKPAIGNKVLGGVGIISGGLKDGNDRESGRMFDGARGCSGVSKLVIDIRSGGDGSGKIFDGVRDCSGVGRISPSPVGNGFDRISGGSSVSGNKVLNGLPKESPGGTDGMSGGREVNNPGELSPVGNRELASVGKIPREIDGTSGGREVNNPGELSPVGNREFASVGKTPREIDGMSGGEKEGSVGKRGGDGRLISVMVRAMGGIRDVSGGEVGRAGLPKSAPSEAGAMIGVRSSGGIGEGIDVSADGSVKGPEIGIELTPGSAEGMAGTEVKTEGIAKEAEKGNEVKIEGGLNDGTDTVNVADGTATVEATTTGTIIDPGKFTDGTTTGTPSATMVLLLYALRRRKERSNFGGERS